MVVFYITQKITKSTIKSLDYWRKSTKKSLKSSDFSPSGNPKRSRSRLGEKKTLWTLQNIQLLTWCSWCLKWCDWKILFIKHTIQHIYIKHIAYYICYILYRAYFEWQPLPQKIIQVRKMLLLGISLNLVRKCIITINFIINYGINCIVFSKNHNVFWQ